MATATKEYGKSMQLWPGGETVLVKGQDDGLRVKFKDEKRWRKPTAKERRKVRIEELAEMYQERDIWCCDSCLVSDLMKAASSGELPREVAEEWEYEKVKNLRPDPSDWGIEKCRDWLDDKGHDMPDEDPWKWGRPELLGFLDGCLDDDIDMGTKTDAELLALAVEYMDDDGGYEDDWRRAVNENAEDAEIYEWWRVDSWLASQLEEVGECVLDNAYGYWWGRTCTGQQMIMDGSLQDVAALYVDKYGY
jgi:hypothetical protein